MCTERKVIVTTNLIQDKHTREVHEDTDTSVPSVNKYSNTRDRLREKKEHILMMVWMLTMMMLTTMTMMKMMKMMMMMTMIVTLKENASRRAPIDASRSPHL